MYTNGLTHFNGKKAASYIANRMPHLESLYSKTEGLYKLEVKLSGSFILMKSKSFKSRRDTNYSKWYCKKTYIYFNKIKCTYFKYVKV